MASSLPDDIMMLMGGGAPHSTASLSPGASPPPELSSPTESVSNTDEQPSVNNGRPTKGGKQPRACFQVQGRDSVIDPDLDHGNQASDNEDADADEYDEDGEDIDEDGNDESNADSTAVGIDTFGSSSKHYKQLQAASDYTRGLANELNLTGNQTNTATELALATLKLQVSHILCYTMDIWNKAKDVEQSWSPNQQALDDIKETCRAVILSSSVPAYKGNMVNDIVLAIVNQRKIGLPDGWQAIPSKHAIVKSCIRTNLTEARSVVKKVLVMSTKKGTDIETVVQILFKKSSMNLKASQESWGRVAIMRKVLVSTPEGKSFWDTVDATMATIRKTADDEHPEDKQGRDDEISKKIKRFLENDYELYGNPMKIRNTAVPLQRRKFKGERFQELVDSTVNKPQSEITMLASNTKKRSAKQVQPADGKKRKTD